MNPGDLEDAALAKRQGLEAYEPAPTQEESSLSASGPEGHVGSAQSPEGGLSTATDAGQSPDRSASTCPTCGTRVKVVGRTTKHYEPIAEARVDMEDLERLRRLHRSISLGTMTVAISEATWRSLGRVLDALAPPPSVRQEGTAQRLWPASSFTDEDRAQIEGALRTSILFGAHTQPVSIIPDDVLTRALAHIDHLEKARKDWIQATAGAEASRDAAEAALDRLEKALRRIEKKHVLEPQAARIARAALEGEDDE